MTTYNKEASPPQAHLLEVLQPTDITLPSSISWLCHQSPVVLEAFQEAQYRDPFHNHHGLMVAEATMSIFAFLVSHLPPNLNQTRAIKQLLPLIEIGTVFHDLGKLDPLLTSSFTAREQTQGTRNPTQVAYDHLHSLTGGYATQELAKLESNPQIAEILLFISQFQFEHHENSNGSFVASDGHPLYSYPRSPARTKPQLIKLTLLAIKLADLSQSMGHPRPYRDQQLPLETITNCLYSLVNHSSIEKLFPHLENRHQLTNDLINFTLQVLSSSQQKYPDELCRHPETIQYTTDQGKLITPTTPSLLDTIFSRVYQNHPHRIETAWSQFLRQASQSPFT